MWSLKKSTKFSKLGSQAAESAINVPRVATLCLVEFGNRKARNNFLGSRATRMRSHIATKLQEASRTLLDETKGGQDVQPECGTNALKAIFDEGVNEGIMILRKCNSRRG